MRTLQRVQPPLVVQLIEPLLRGRHVERRFDECQELLDPFRLSIGDGFKHHRRSRPEIACDFRARLDQQGHQLGMVRQKLDDRLTISKRVEGAQLFNGLRKSCCCCRGHAQIVTEGEDMITVWTVKSSTGLVLARRRSQR